MKRARIGSAKRFNDPVPGDSSPEPGSELDTVTADALRAGGPTQYTRQRDAMQAALVQAVRLGEGGGAEVPFGYSVGPGESSPRRTSRAARSRRDAEPGTDVPSLFRLSSVTDECPSDRSTSSVPGSASRRERAGLLVLRGLDSPGPTE